ncbi:MAG: YbjN domain-containing protein [Alphaproteobacteria bacterium]|nr:YbjN domain-containing protein [Alphaproteobacteria bacterium]
MRVVALLPALLLGAVLPAAAECLTDVLPQGIAAELAEAGYKADIGTTEDGQPFIETGMQSATVTVFLYDCAEGGNCTGLTMRTGFNLQAGMSYEQINQWNYDNRLSRAFLDNERDPYIEGDITLTGGLARDDLVAGFSGFESQLADFKDFIGWD